MRSKALATGLYGAMKSANAATTTMTMMTAAPAAPSGLRRANRTVAASRLRGLRSSVSSMLVPRSVATVMQSLSPSFVPDPRVEPRIDDVHHEVGEDEDRHHQHDQRLCHRVIVIAHGRDKQLAEPVEIEHLLGDHQAAHQECEFDADDGDHRQQRVSERMPPDDELLDEPLGARR